MQRKTSTNNLQVTFVQDEVKLKSLRETWNDLVFSGAGDSVFFRYEWFESAWQWCKLESKLFTICVYKQEQLIGILPLILKSHNKGLLKIRMIEFLAVPDTQECDVISLPENKKAVLDASLVELSRHANEWDQLVLTHLRASSDTGSLLLQLFKQHGYEARVEMEAKNYMVHLDQGWEEYYSTRSRGLKKGNNHLANRLNKRVDTIEVKEYVASNISGEDKNSSPIEMAVGISEKSWKNSTGLSLDNKGPGDFIRHISQYAVENNWLRLWILFLDDTAVAMEYQLSYAGKIHALRADFDKTFDDLSVGSYLNWKLLIQLFGKDDQAYLMGPGENPYKKRWADDAVDLMQVVCYGKTLTGVRLRVLYNLKRIIKAVLKK